MSSPAQRGDFLQQKEPSCQGTPDSLPRELAVRMPVTPPSQGGLSVEAGPCGHLCWQQTQGREDKSRHDCPLHPGKAKTESLSRGLGHRKALSACWDSPSREMQKAPQDLEAELSSP